MSEITITTQELQVSFVIGLLSGIVASVVVALATYLITYYWRKWALKRKYGKAQGKNYKGYTFERYDKDEGEHKRGESKWVLGKEPISKAEIEYEQNNILSVTVTSLKDKNPETGEYLIWDGKLMMELENFGTIAWRYRNLQKPQHRFGFKRCIVREESNKLYVYLIGEEVEGYGKEVLIRDK